MPAGHEDINNHNGAPSDVPIDTSLRLVVSSERTIEAVDKLLEDAEKHKTDNQYIKSINQAHSKNIPLHYYRGYTVVGDMKPIQEVTQFSDDKRPIWFVYSGFRSYCLGAAKGLMHLDVFRNSINRCADVLRPKGVDLLHILTEIDESIFDNIINIFVSIVSMQVAFTDLLAHLGITPNGIIGISLGDFGSAYADGCSTLEQTILAAYWVGHSIVNSEIIPSRMVIVGLSLREALARIPSDVFVGGHYAIDKVVLSGPLESISDCVNKLTNEGIYVKDLGVHQIALHSEYMAEVAEKLRKSLEQIYPSPKNRTSRWISTCFPESDWSTSDAQQFSAAYFSKNLLSPVLFYDAMQHVPKNAICIEIAPIGGKFGKVFKQTVGPDVTFLYLNDNVHENNLLSCLISIGKLYVAGAQPAVAKLHHSVS